MPHLRYTLPQPCPRKLKPGKHRANQQLTQRSIRSESLFRKSSSELGTVGAAFLSVCRELRLPPRAFFRGGKSLNFGRTFFAVFSLSIFGCFATAVALPGSRTHL